ncbi:MAG: hypothetical protein MUE54_12590 [Anaerolineae bacterium]|nr:hypothetical protein [Anaerolineae bacterium]
MMSIITQITLPDDLYERLEQTAQAQNRALDTLIVDLITSSLDTLDEDDDSDEYIIASFRQSWKEAMTGVQTRSIWDLLAELDDSLES